MREAETEILIVGGGLGGVAGALAAWCLDRDRVPSGVRNDPDELADFQGMLSRDLRFELAWPQITPR